MFVPPNSPPTNLRVYPPAFSRHFRTITFDVRGERGLEGGIADLTVDVVALLEHLNVRKAHVLGVRLIGGFVAQQLGLERPDLVDRLTSCARATVVGVQRPCPRGH
jgi:pimeloyl-ACP methyl ester carboxylesterase